MNGPSAESLRPAPDARRATRPKEDRSARRPYHTQRLRALGAMADLLEVLGPAQAGYGGPI